MANEFKINEADLDAVLAEVTGEIADLLRKDEALLAKAVDDDSPPPDDEPAETSEGSAGPSDPVEASGEGSAPPMGDEGSAPASPDQAAAAAAPEGSPEHEGGEIEPAPTVEGLLSEYMKLDPEALKMHYMAAKEAIMQQMGGGAGPDASLEGAAPAAPPAPPAPGPEASASAPPALKGEMGAGKKVNLVGKANGGKMQKSESEAQLEAEVKALKETLAKQEDALLKLAETVAKPLRKSVRGLSDLTFLAKEGEVEKKSPVASLSKSEIVVKLREKTRNEQLSKSDRDLINQYTVGSVDVSKIEHLLTSGK